MIETLTTERLLLSPLTHADALAIDGDVRAADWAAGYPTDGDRRIARFVLESAYDDERALGLRKIVDRDSGLVIGGIGFVRGPDEDGVIAVGYGLASAWRGRGLATEALVAMLGHACAAGSVRQVVADTEADHVASRRVMEKAGMRLDRVDGAQVFYAYDCPGAVPSAP